MKPAVAINTTRACLIVGLTPPVKECAMTSTRLATHQVGLGAGRLSHKLHVRNASLTATTCKRTVWPLERKLLSSART
jgi:hypothetical protein